MKTAALLFVLASAACHPSASTPDRAVQTIGAGSVPSARYHTFAFGLAEPPAAPYALSERSFEVEQRLEPFIVAELTKKGYALSEGNADFLVRFSAERKPHWERRRLPRDRLWGKRIASAFGPARCPRSAVVRARAGDKECDQSQATGVQ